MLLSLSANVAAQQAAVPVEQEPYHHVVLKNDDVIVLHVTLAPGQVTQYHIHPRDRAGVYLAECTTTQQKLGNPEELPKPSHPGDVFADATADHPLTHRVHNVGSTNMDIIDVEFLRRPVQSSTAAIAPVAAENPTARIYRWSIAPGAATPMHTHTRPYLIVAVTPMELKMTAPDGQSRTEQVKTGDFHWIDAGVTHSLVNTGSTQGEIVEFELK
jgi:quercetin dioxygenase-like cupin family protein